MEKKPDIVDFILVTGFLGSGKTTLLKQILATYSAVKRIAVIQNEYAPAGIDGEDLSREGYPFRLVELNNGSVFCVCMLGTFLESLDQLVNHHKPELILLESSGLSDPVNIIELLYDERIRNRILLNHIISVADALHIEKGLAMMPRVRHQLMIADTLILNKSDLFNGNMTSLRKRLKDLNPFAEIVETSYCKLNLDHCFSGHMQQHLAAKRFAGESPEGRPDINTAVLRTHDKIDITGLEALIHELVPGCMRIKGFVNLADGRTIGLQSVFGVTAYEDIHSYNGPTELVTFGAQITPGELRREFRKYALK